MPERLRWSFGLGLFGAGFLCAWVVQFLLARSEDPFGPLVLLPFLLAVGVFAVAAALFLRESRQALGRGSDAAVDGLRSSLDQTRSGFEEEIERALEGMRGALSTIVRQGEIVYELNLDDPDEHERDNAIGEKPAFRSRCYEHLIELVSNAQESIFAIPNPYREDCLHSRELAMREEYLRAIERKLGEMNQKGQRFQYIRIQQVRRGINREDLRSHMGRLEAAHIERMLDIKDVLPYCQVKLMYIENDEITGQLIIDGKIFVNLISALDSKGRKRLVAIGIMTDPVGDTVAKYYDELIWPNLISDDAQSIRKF